jgi:opacity protein-like surface antigen
MGLRVSLLLLALLPPAAAAQSRAGKWEMYLLPVFTVSDNLSFDGGASAEIESGFGFGFGAAKNFSPSLAAGVDVFWTEAEYHATVTPGAGNAAAPVQVRSTLRTSTLRLHGTYHFFPGRFTPFATGGLGWTKVETNVPTVLPLTACWYYPWFGEICQPYGQEKDSTKFSYDVGAGLRYDLTELFVVRASVHQQWMNFGGSYGSSSTTLLRFDAGLMFR